MTQTERGNAASDLDRTAVDASIKEALAEHPGPDFWLNVVAIMGRATEIARFRDEEEGKPSADQASVQILVFDLCKLFMKQQYFAKRPELCEPMMRLSNSLFELNYGRTSALFKPVKTTKNPGKPNSHALIKGQAARALSELMAGGIDPKQAASIVASALAGAEKRGLGNITSETVINWRERIHQKRGKSKGGDEGADLFAYNWDLSEFGDSPLVRGKYLVDNLKKHAASGLT